MKSYPMMLFLYALLYFALFDAIVAAPVDSIQQSNLNPAPDRSHPSIPRLPQASDAGGSSQGQSVHLYV
jgi:hypothetical protein